MPKPPLTDVQKATRTARRHDILLRVNGSGEAVSSDDAIAIAKTIESFEWADGDAAEGARRKAIIMPLLGSGATRIADVVKAAQAQLDALGSFE